MITAAEMRALEMRSEQHGVSREQLMENAGSAAADVIRERCPGARLLVICYHGNNGGDGFVLARILGCHVWFLGNRAKLRPEALAAFGKLKREQFVDHPRLEAYDILVDALLGTGTIGGLRGKLLEFAKVWISSPCKKVALDIPTGIDPDRGAIGQYLESQLIIAFHDMKLGLQNLGIETVVVPIGIPEEACTP